MKGDHNRAAPTRIEIGQRQTVVREVISVQRLRPLYIEEAGILGRAAENPLKASAPNSNAARDGAVLAYHTRRTVRLARR